MPLPLPALHATHAGIWIAGADGEAREASRGEAIVHLWAAGAGHDSTRWMEIETEERRRRSADIRRVR